MTSSVMIVHTGGNKKVRVKVMNNTADGGVERAHYDLTLPGQHTGAQLINIYEGQYVIVEEYGEFIN